MHYRNLMSGSARQNGIPFICQNMPFVCINNPVESPFVGRKIPFVGIKGFTLVELIKTMTIAGILMAIAVPGMGNLIRNHRLSGQANDLLADLAFARSEAIKRSVTVTVCKQNASSATPACNTTSTAPWTGGWVVFIDTNNDGLIDTAPAENILRLRSGLEGGNYVTAANTSAAAGSGFDNAANLVRFRNTGATTINPTAAAPAGASPGAPTGIARFRLCDSRGVNAALTVELTTMGRARVNSTRPFDPNNCPANSNW